MVTEPGPDWVVMDDSSSEVGGVLSSEQAPRKITDAMVNNQQLMYFIVMMI